MQVACDLTGFLPGLWHTQADKLSAECDEMKAQIDEKVATLHQAAEDEEELRQLIHEERLKFQDKAQVCHT